MNHLWQGSFFGDLRSVDVHVRHLRQKVEADRGEPDADPHRTGRRVRIRSRRHPHVRRRFRRRPGLQVWLVAILIAVGALASLAVVLSIVPTFESSLRDARASATAKELATELSDQLNQMVLPTPDSREALTASANKISSAVEAQVRVTDLGATPVLSGGSIGCCKLLNQLHQPTSVSTAPVSRDCPFESST